MANNPTTPYFTRFARESARTPDITLSFVALCPERPAMLDEMKALGCDCHWIPFDSRRRKRSYLGAFSRLLALFLRHRPDIVHAHLFDDALPGLLAARLAAIPVRMISKLDAGFHYLHAPRLVALDRLNNRNATTIVAVSEENRRFVVEMEGADPRKVVLIHQGLPEAEVMARSNELRSRIAARLGLEGRKVVLTVARFVDLKGYPDIVKAAKLVLARRADVRFVCVGYGDRRRVEESISEAGLQEAFVLSGWLSREELNELYGLASVYLHAALVEPFGFVIAEAMFNRVPVVSTRVGAAQDGLEHGLSGFLVDPGDSAGLAEGICSMLARDVSELTSRARLSAERLFSIAAMWDKHAEVYRRAVKQP